MIIVALGPSQINDSFPAVHDERQTEYQYKQHPHKIFLVSNLVPKFTIFLTVETNFAKNKKIYKKKVTFIWRDQKYSADVPSSY